MRDITYTYSSGDTVDCCATHSMAKSINMSNTVNSVVLDNFISDEGITVKGSEVNQQFQYGYIDELENISHVLVLKLKGYNSKEEKIKQPLLVKTKVQCKTCGELNTSKNKFCSSCGTFLE